MAENPASQASGGIKRWRFRPTFWLTVSTLSTLALLVGLGIWQLQRLEWKEAGIAERKARIEGPPITLPRAIEDAEAEEIEALEFTRVGLRGRFLHDNELYLSSRTYKGVVGFHIVTPFVLEDGRSLLVNRGWVPMKRRDPATRSQGQLPGEIAIEGILRRGGWKGRDFLRPPNTPAENIWLWFDLPAMAVAAELEKPVTTLYVEAIASDLPGGLPIGVETQITIANDHLGYAITWFTLAFALLVIFVIYSTRLVPGNREPGEG